MKFISCLIPLLITFLLSAQYRQIAPESLDDSSLRELIKSKNNNYDAIAGALNDIWQGKE